mgnify:CR=1 FL=1
MVCAAFPAGTPPLDGVVTVAFRAMAAALGSGSGATFALIAQVTDPSRGGGVTGLVGAAGGLGGFVKDDDDHQCGDEIHHRFRRIGEKTD